MSRLSADHCEHCRAEQNQQFQETSRGADSVELETFFERCELQFGIFSASSPGCSTGFDSADLILGGPKFHSECSILETEFVASRMQHRNNFVCGRSILFQGFRHVCIPAGIWFWAHPNNGINLTIPAQRHNISFLTAQDYPTIDCDFCRTRHSCPSAVSCGFNFVAVANALRLMSLTSQLSRDRSIAPTLAKARSRLLEFLTSQGDLRKDSGFQGRSVIAGKRIGGKVCCTVSLVGCRLIPESVGLDRRL